MCFVFHSAGLHQLFARLRGIEAQRNNLTPNIFIWSVDWYGNWSGIRSSRVKILVGPIENNHESGLQNLKFIFASSSVTRFSNTLQSSTKALNILGVIKCLCNQRVPADRALSTRDEVLRLIACRESTGVINLNTVLVYGNLVVLSGSVFLVAKRMLSRMEVTMATPTMSNARKPYHQLSSCFVDTVPDSLDGIYRSLDNFAKVSKFGGGMGMYFGKVRAAGSTIRGFQGAAGGVIRWIRLVNDTAVAVDQLGMRQGAVAVYLDAWHRDLPEFLQLRTNNGDDRMKAHDVFPAVCYPDLFWRLAEENIDAPWHLMCPHEILTVKGYALEDYWGTEWEKRYLDCVNDPRIEKRSVTVKDIVRLVLRSAVETGTPFAFNRDSVNRMNPNGHTGMIYCSNLCTEIAQNMAPIEHISTEVHTENGDTVVVTATRPGVIQNRRSVHAFREKEVPSEAIGQLRSYYEKTCPRLVPEIATELIVLDKDAQPALESSAGYKQFLIGAPHYLLLMSAPHSYAAINAGYMMEDLVLKLTELDIDTCWMTFTDSDKIKKALSLTTPLEVAAIVAFGYGEKTAKKLRLNILSMSQIDVRAEQQYYAPKKSVHDLVHMGSWSNKSGLDEMMDFYDDMLWQSFYAASLSPSYLNRQPYGFLVQDHSIYLVQQEDAYTDNLDAALDLGIVMLHFSAVASRWAGQVRWELSPAAPDGLPEGLRSAAVYHM